MTQKFKKNIPYQRLHLEAVTMVLMLSTISPNGLYAHVRPRLFAQIMFVTIRVSFVTGF